MHTPDKTKLPLVLQQLPWQQVSPETWYNDGEKLLVAVPICCEAAHPERGYFYSLEIVTVKCDEDYFAIETADGDSWGWDLDDADWMVRLDCHEGKGEQ